MSEALRAGGRATPLVVKGANLLELLVVSMLGCTHGPSRATLVVAALAIAIAIPVVVPGTIGIAPVATPVPAIARRSLTGPALFHKFQAFVNLQTK